MDFHNISDLQITFGPNTSSLVALVYVEIIDDDLFEEEIESFSVALSTQVPRLQLDTGSVTINITDTDSK